MSESFIIKNPSLEPSQDYALLRKEGFEWIEKLAHQVWTDYNVHDPGITILELFCYGLSDLGYRTGYDIKDILTEWEDGEEIIKANFHTALNIFPCNPVTFNDLRKLLVDIEGIRNAWISRHDQVIYCLDRNKAELLDCPSGNLPAQQEKLDPLNGLYDVLLQFEEDISESREVHVGLLDVPETAVFQLPGQEAMVFHVLHPLRLNSVQVLSDQTGEVEIHLYDRNDTLVISSGPHKVEKDVPGIIPLGEEIEPGKNYRLTAEGSTVALAQSGPEDFGPFEVTQVISLRNGFDGVGENDRYYYFYDWNLSYAVEPLGSLPDHPQIDIESTTGLLQASDPSDLAAYKTLLKKGIVFDVEQAMVLEAIHVYAHEPFEVIVSLFDKHDTLIKQVSQALVGDQSKEKILLEVGLSPGINYRLVAQGPVGKQLHSSSGVNFQHPEFEEAGVLDMIRGTASLTNYYFFYDWRIQYQEEKPDDQRVEVSEVTKEDIRLAVQNRLHSYRNLCEDYIEIHELLEEKIGICADLEVKPEANIEEVLAQIFYQAELHISPPVNFYTIDELKAREKTVDQIFSGPILDHGFIDDDEFRELERRCYFRSSDIIQILMDIEGVTAVKEISLLSYIYDEEGNKTLVDQQPWILEMSDPARRVADFDPTCSRIIFYKNKLPYYPNLDKVMDLYEELRAADVHRKLKGHEQDLPIPKGTFRSLESYSPLQNDLPPAYRVGNHRVEASATDKRRAQSRQLKGYLMFFEQMLANYLSQLSHVKDLFSWGSPIAVGDDPCYSADEASDVTTYFTQAILSILEVEDIYQQYPLAGITDLKMHLQSIIETPAIAEERKNRFLNHLMGRFSEDMSDYEDLTLSMYPDSGARLLITDKQRFLEDYPVFSRDRGKAYDYRFPTEPDNISGYQHRLYRLLGIRDEQHRLLAGHRFSLEVDSEGKWFFALLDEEGEVLLTSITCSSKALICTLLDSSIALGAKLENFQLQEREDDPETFEWSLINTCADSSETVAVLHIEATEDEEIPTQVMDVWKYFRQVNCAEGFHLLEHILLRKRSAGDAFMPVSVNAEGEDCDCVEVADPYSFRATILLPSWPERFRHIRFRKYVEDLLRLEAPAHVYLKICWINHCDMIDFEGRYERWRYELSLLPEELRGALPLPGITGQDETGENLFNAETQAQLSSYQYALSDLIDQLHDLTNVFPLARLHDCEEIDSDSPQITLNNTNLGTF